MYDLFIELGHILMQFINISINASWLVLAVVLLRLLMKKAPKWVNCILWGLVAIRLVVPVPVESVLSLIPSSEPLPVANIYNPDSNIANNHYYHHVDSGVKILDTVIDTLVVNTTTSALRSNMSIIACLWLVGMVAMILYATITCIRLYKKVREGLVLKDNIWLCDRIDTPFILGLFKPRIFLPSGITENDMEYVIAHENAHLRRRDHWWKPLGFILLTVYWFNPVMWLAYILLCRDIELACDEKVIKEMGADIKKSYSEALINCSVSRRTISACPLAFGETGVKDRIKSVLSYKKPTLWVIIIAVISCIAVAVCFLTNPKSDLKDSNPELDSAVSQAILDINSTKELYNAECLAEGHIIYGIEEDGDNVTVYLLEEFAGFGFKNGYFMEQTGHRTPAVYTFSKIDDAYTLTDYEYPLDGESYTDSIREMFPKEYHSRILDYNEKDNADMWEQCVAYAEAYLKKIGREAEVRDYSEVPHIFLTDLGVSVEISNGIIENKTIAHYDSDIGNYEKLEDGVRFIYRTDFDEEKNLIIFTREIYATGEITEKIEIDAATGRFISNNTYDCELPEPETEQTPKNYSLPVYGDYTIAADEVRNQYSIKAIHYPAAGKVESGILMGEAYGYDVAEFLDNVYWKESLPPIESLSSPGSVEFVIDDNYRVTVYERKKGSVFAYAVVKYGDTERYYHASYDDYGDALALLHAPSTVSEQPVDGIISYSYLTENDSAYISINPDTKTVFFSLSRFSDYVIEGTYQDYIDRIFILANDKQHKYVLRRKGADLIFSAEESTPVPEYRYSENSYPIPCIPEGAVFAYNGIDYTYIDKTTADIDGDGINEYCILGYGPTSGLFTVTFSAYENGHLEYFNIFNSDVSDIQFGADKDGKTVIKGQVFADYDNQAYATYEISIKDGNIVLGSGDSMIAYWGEQGLDSPYAPK